VTRSRVRGLTPPLPNNPSRRSAQLKHRDNFNLLTLTVRCGLQWRDLSRLLRQTKLTQRSDPNCPLNDERTKHEKLTFYWSLSASGIVTGTLPRYSEFLPRLTRPQIPFRIFHLLRFLEHQLKKRDTAQSQVGGTKRNFGASPVRKQRGPNRFLQAAVTAPLPHHVRDYGATQRR